MTASSRYSRKGLFLPFLLVGLALAAWTGWWFYLAHQVETRLADRTRALNGAGWAVAHAPVSVSGWPFRARLDVRDLSLTAPSGHAVEIPRLLVEAAAWEPLKWVGFAPDGLALARPGKGRVRLDGGPMRFSISHIDRAVPDLRIQLHDPVFTAETGAEAFPLASAALVHFQARPNAGPDGAVLADQAAVLFRLIDAEGRPSGPVEGLARQGRMTLEGQAVIQAVSALGAGDASGALAGWSRKGGALTQVSGRLTAGDSRADFRAERLDAGPDGRLRGSLSLQALHADAALAGLAAAPSGAVDRRGARAASDALPAPSGPAPADGETGAEAGTVPLDIVFRDGRAWLGPFALAPAPRLF